MAGDGGRRTWRVAPEHHVVLADGRTAVLRPLQPGDGDLLAAFFAGLTPRETHYFYALEPEAASRLATGPPAGEDAFRLLALESPPANAMRREGPPRVAGYMDLEWKAGDNEPVLGACLHETVQSGGLGRAMLDHLLSSAAASGVATVRLTVHADNWRALRLYQRMGFRPYDEMILQHQGARQYRMRADLRLRRPATLDDLVVVARGGLGVGLAAARVQAALADALGALPLLLDRPVRPDAHAVLLVDLAAAAEHPFAVPEPPALHGAAGPAWVTSLDERRVLLAGLGAAAVEWAAASYLDLLAAWIPPAGPPAGRVSALPRPGPVR